MVGLSEGERAEARPRSAPAGPAASGRPQGAAAAGHVPGSSRLRPGHRPGRAPSPGRGRLAGGLHAIRALMTEPQQGLSYADILAAARAAEAAGLRGVLPLRPLRQLPRAAGPAHHRCLGHPWPAWRARRAPSTWARSSRRSPSGIPATFAKVAATVDEMSGGRLEVGMGAGWNDEEHAGHGFPFRRCPSDTTGWRRRSPSSMACGPSLTAGAIDGQHWQIRDALFHPKPTASAAAPPAPDPGRGRAAAPQAALVAR